MRATPDQLLTLGLSAVLVVAIHLLLTRTAIGRSMRAVSENQQLAGVVGIDVRKVIRTVWLLGAGLACVAGIMAGLLVQIRPHMGHDLLLPLFAAAILGGIGSVPGAMLAGLIVGLSEVAGRAVHRRGMARRGRLRHPGRRAAASTRRACSGGRHERGTDRLRRLLPHHRADLRHHVPRPQCAVGPDRTVQCRRRRLRCDRRLCLGHPDHAGLAEPPGWVRPADRDRLAGRHVGGGA